MDSFVTTDGVKIAYEAAGRGPIVIACGGGPANDHRYLADDLQSLTTTCEVVFHDYRGSGASGTAPHATYTLGRLAEDVEELRSHLGQERVSVLGHSMGGFVAFEYALRYPDRCNRLVLAGASPTTDPRRMLRPTLRALGGPRLAKMLARLVAWPVRFGWRPRTPEARRHLYGIWATTQEGEPAIRRIEADRERRLGLPLDNDNIRSLQQQLSSWDLSVNLGKIRCPVLLVYGSRDAIAVAGAEIFQAELRNIEVCRLEGVGHDPFFEAPNASIAAVQAFILGA